jgi:ribose 5-phosphate isomerase A
MDFESFVRDQVRSGDVVGLGTGRAAERCVRTLGARVAEGLDVRGVATSRATEDLARALAIPLVSLEDVPGVDVAFDGADEVDPEGRMIKGYGGALLREKVVAASAQRVVIVVGPEKCVAQLGTFGRLPVEVLPFALAPVLRRLEQLGIPGTARRQGDRPLRSDNGHLLVDCRLGPLSDPAALDRALHGIPGLLETGLFLDRRATIAIVGPDGVQVRVPSAGD